MHQQYIEQGISCVYVDANKRAIRPWKIYQSEIPNIHELEIQQDDKKAAGIAVICGKISGNLEIIDIDAKYDLSGVLFDNFISLLPSSIIPFLYIITTKNKGYHIYYRCEVIAGNTKLAMRPTTDEERKANPQDKVRVLIETRGEAGYCVAPPTKGYCKKGAEDIPVITIEQRETILSAARSFNQVKEEVREHRNTLSTEYAISPFDDYNRRGVDDMLNKLVYAGWKEISNNDKKITFLRPGKTESKSSGDYNYELGWFSVFTTSSQFEPNKAYRPSAVFCLLECNNDWKLCARKLMEMGYGEQRKQIGGKIQRDVYRKKEEGASAEDIAAYVSSRHKITVSEAKEVVAQLEKQWGEKICTFWEVNDKGAASIVRTKMQDFLSEVGGFFIYYYDTSSPIYKMIRVVDGFVEEATTEHIKKYIKEYIETLPDSFDGITQGDLLEIIYKGSDAYFSKSLLEFMPRIKLNLLKDTKDAAFFPYKNGVVKVTRDKKELIRYGDINMHVWRSQVIDFNIDIDEAIDWNAVEYMRFIEKICSDDIERIKYVVGLIGYLLHKWKDPTRPYAIILAEETEKDKEGGGTGKGIFYKAVSKILNVVFVDGKNFKLDKSFAFQRVNLDTQLVVIEDCRKNVDFEGFYSNITEGVTVEKKNKDELYIPYSDSPKFGFTTNYTITLSGTHAKRRAKVIEFSNFFSNGSSPLDYFGHALFDGWDQDEWNRFYNLMIECVQLFMLGGISERYSSVTIKRKQIKNNYGEEFLEYFDDLLKNKWFFFGEEYLYFLKLNDFEKKDFSQKRFRSALDSACDVFGLSYQDRKNRSAENRKEFFIT